MEARVDPVDTKTKTRMGTETIPPASSAVLKGAALLSKVKCLQIERNDHVGDVTSWAACIASSFDALPQSVFPFLTYSHIRRPVRTTSAIPSWSVEIGKLPHRVLPS